MKKDTAEIFSVKCLRFAKDTYPGIRRDRTDTGFRYIDPHGKEVTDSANINRIQS